MFVRVCKGMCVSVGIDTIYTCSILHVYIVSMPALTHIPTAAVGSRVQNVDLLL